MSTPPKPNIPTSAKAPPKSAKRAAAIDADALTPAKPAGYQPVGDVVVLAEANGVRVCSDDVRTWKELAE